MYEQTSVGGVMPWEQSTQRETWRGRAKAALAALRDANLLSPEGLTREDAKELIAALACLGRVRAVLNLNLPDIAALGDPAARNVVDALNDIAANAPLADQGLSGYGAYPRLRQSQGGSE